MSTGTISPTFHTSSPTKTNNSRTPLERFQLPRAPAPSSYAASRETRIGPPGARENSDYHFSDTVSRCLFFGCCFQPLFSNTIFRTPISKCVFRGGTRSASESKRFSNRNRPNSLYGVSRDDDTPRGGSRIVNKNKQGIQT